MSLSFPVSPSVGQIYGNWIWNGQSWDAVVGSPVLTGIVAYFTGTLTPTSIPSGNATGVNTSTGVITFGSAHGLVTGQFAITVGTPPVNLGAGNGWYVRALSTTTCAMYTTLADALADTNRVLPSSSVATFTLRPLILSSVVSRGFDTVNPIGAWAAHSNVYPELHLTNPIVGASPIVLLGPINSMARSTDAALTNAWGQVNPPLAITPTLLRYSANWAVEITSGAVAPTWAQQAAFPMVWTFVVVA